MSISSTTGLIVLFIFMLTIFHDDTIYPYTNHLDFIAIGIGSFAFIIVAYSFSQLITMLVSLTKIILYPNFIERYWQQR